MRIERKEKAKLDGKGIEEQGEGEMYLVRKEKLILDFFEKFFLD